MSQYYNKNVKMLTIQKIQPQTNTKQDRFKVSNKQTTNSYCSDLLLYNVYDILLQNK